MSENSAVIERATDTGPVDADKAFFQAVQQKAISFAGTQVQSTLYPVQYPAQGDFEWYYFDVNQVFNQGTFDYISALASPGNVPGTVQLGASGSFPNGYVQVTTALAYSLSTANQSALNQAQNNAATQGNAIITNYQNLYGTITPDMMAKAKVGNKLDYVMNYILGSVWSGVNPPLSWTKMKSARNLSSLLPNMPASGEQILPSVTTYLNILSPVLSLQDQLNQGMWIRNQLVTNTQTPSADNLGMQTVNPATGTVLPGYQVGYSIPKSLSDISNSLQNKQNTFSIGMEVSSASGSSLSVSVEGSTGFSIGEFLTFNVGASGSYNMTKAQGTSSDCKVSIQYTGVTVVPIEPTAWQQAPDTGWYYADPIANAVANQGQDVDGFKFTTTLPYNFGAVQDGGNFGLLNALLVGNFPTITLTYSNADFASFKQAWQESVSGNLTLFGLIKLGSFSQGAYGSSYQQGADNTTFTLTFAPSPQLLSVPQMQQLAYVIAGAVTNPGVSA